MSTWFRNCMDLLAKFNCKDLLSSNLRSFNSEQQRSYRKTAKRSITRNVHNHFAHGWLQPSSAITCKLSTKLKELDDPMDFSTVCIPMHLYDGSTSYIHTYTQCRGWLESGSTISSYNILQPLCREALLLYRTGVAPLWINEVDISKNASVNRFRRTCDFCMHVYNCRFMHDAFHVLFECPLFCKERTLLFERVPPDMVRDVLGVQQSLYELHIMLLCPPTLSIASAVGHFLSCSIAKLGMFKALIQAVPIVGPMHYAQSINAYKGKWLKSYKHHMINQVYNDVINMFIQPRSNSICVRSMELIEWASNCVLEVNNVYSLNLLLPLNWKHIIMQIDAINISE